MFKGRMLVLDIETTGLDSYRDEIIEFAAWSLQEGLEAQLTGFLIKPRQKVPERILELTGIKETELLEAEPLEHYRSQITALLKDAILVGHNVMFDIGFLERSLGMTIRNEVWDTLELVRLFFPGFNQYRLQDCARQLKIEGVAELHRAREDSRIAWKLAEACWRKGLDLDLSFYRRAIPLAEGLRSRGFLKELAKEIERSFPDRPIRTDLALFGTEDGLFGSEYVRAKPVPPEAAWIEGCFEPGGLLEKSLKGYESRPGQLKMAKATGRALMTSRHLVVEAGTGTGKSYAYLLPGIWWAKKNAKKVVVATHTIPLQEQLFKKDIPVLSDILPFPYKGALLKGKGNYLCLKKWLGMQGYPQELSAEIRQAMLSVLIWLRETRSGDWQEIAQIPAISKLWSEINADYDRCIPAKCLEASRCFMMRAKKQAEEADIIIVNHSLLFSDIKTGNNVLPEYHHLVIDEAHHLQQSALEQLGNEVSLEQINYALDLLFRPTGGSLLTNVRAKSNFWNTVLPSEIWENFSANLSEIPEICREITEQAVETFESFASILGQEQTYRLTSQLQSEDWWQTLVVQIENLLGRINRAIERLKTMQNLLSGLEVDECGELIFEIAARSRDLDSIRECFALALQIQDSSRVSWLEDSGRLMLKTSPVDVSDILKEKLFSPMESVILTSATVSISSSFHHFLEGVGLDAHTDAMIVESPFDYEKQMQLLVVKDLVSATSGDLYNNDEIAQFVADVAQRMQGRTLVLFTSHRFLRAIHTTLKQQLDHTGIDVLAQGIEGSRKAVLEEFVNNPKSVLLGASSFWEGIDIPGHNLSCVILIRLPFWPPTMPLIAARSEYLEERGKNAFYDYQLPEAVLRLKQGFGRLIRSKTDRGVVILCDSRAIEKRYGRVFLTSLPVQTHSRLNKLQVHDVIEHWAKR